MREKTTTSHLPVKRKMSALISSAKSEQLFFAQVVQPKLTVSTPDDKYEREADKVADKVMQMPSVEPLASRAGMPVTPVQRKCIACEKEEKLHREEEEKEETVLPKLIEDYPIGNNSIQQKCAACEMEEKNSLQRQEESGAETPTPSFESALGGSKGNGSPLPDDTRSFMESRFGADFSNVRIYTNSEAASMNSSINAYAFTHGQDIYFNKGQYDPDNSAGKKLLAHELTHVIQQGRSRIRPKTNTSNDPPPIQRAYWVGADPKGKALTGTRLHHKILKDLGRNKGNPDLFVEAPVPNADLKSPGYDKHGSADFYKASTTVGVEFKGHFNPAYLKAPGKLRLGGKKFDHEGKSAPKYTNKDVVELANAPGQIKIGDLKPFGAEELDPKYQEQVSNYQKGYEMVENEIKDMSADESAKNRLSPGGGNWNVRVAPMSSSDIKIPDKYKIGSAKAQSVRMVLKEGTKKYFLDRKITGKLYVAYRKDHQGIWNYVWAPDQALTAANLPASVRDLQINLNNLLDPLSDVRLQPKRMPKEVEKKDSRSNVSLKKEKGIQRKNGLKKKDQFKFEVWKQRHKDFGTKYKAIPEKDIKEAEGKAASQKTQKELKSKFNISTGAAETKKEKENAKLVKQVKFWSHPQTVIVGKIRRTFGTLFVKIHRGIAKLKQKTKKLISGARKKISSGGILGAVIKLFVKIFRIVGKLMLDKTIDLVLNSIMEGARKKVNAFIEELIPDEVEQHIEKLKAIQKEFEDKAAAKVEEVLKKLGPYLKIFEVINKIRGHAEKASSIISLVKWGARLIACASPPGIGCLWAIAQGVIEKLAAKVIESCWFTKKAGPQIAPILGKIDLVTSLPGTTATFIIQLMNGLMPKGWEDTFPKPSEQAFKSIKPVYDNSCGESQGGGDRFAFKDRQEIMELVEEIGEEKFLAFLEMMRKRGAGPWVLLTADRLKAIKGDLKRIKIENLQKIAEGEKPESGIPVSFEDFLKDISKYTEREKKVKKEFFENKAKKVEEEKEGKGGEKGSGEKGKGTGEESGSESGKSVPHFTGKVTKGTLGKKGDPLSAAYSATAYTKKLNPGDQPTKGIKVDLKIYVYNGKNLEKVVEAHSIILMVEKIDDEKVYFKVPEDILIKLDKGTLGYAAGVIIKVRHNYMKYTS